MNILILGYGKMGKIISQVAEERGHQIVAKINIENVADLDHLDTSKIDVAIEFSQPGSAVGNITWCMQHGVPVVVGTTGWMDDKDGVTNLCKQKDGSLFYTSNFSIGVNIFFKVNAFLSKLMNDQEAYKATLEEIHHTEKKDAPSGTAITLAEGLIKNNQRYSSWELQNDNTQQKEGTLPITSKRIDPAPGTHIVSYKSEIDDITINHTAHNRKGFALGAVLVAEWLPGKKGVLSMDDFLDF
ncbi:4-hydroxy-tetrahydrodipicolinate reductase [Cyclobacterium qasimii]|uniref:4-hydroxy-tetrahydrodipicolinate reductase n=2 Tax=Cyclobacterium qasimii TaxID=1350429 RepID=S7WG75_9BACT|nr:4-hydroxy-tetrahydrodipicolinate reductase [Cyclobacterium qasimii]EPR65749.1 Dihydrodipicolinate reductase [Cyclobacterium qasimii M12-11B]GEO22462.1 4-hydroxy-tetrahydrodipicolinate reductase [Cyclobacterium qasimii]